MTAFVFANYVDTTLAAAASSTATSLSLSSSANLPALGPGEIMPLTLNDAATGLVYEIVYVTAISGTTLTVLRGQEGTAAQNWSSGDYAFVSPTADTVAPVAGTHSPVASETLPVVNDLITTPGTLTADIDLTLNDVAPAGSGGIVFGSESAFSVTVQSPVTTGSPYIELPDGSQVYSWVIPASEAGQGIRYKWDGTNWRARTFGQTVVAPATQNNEATQLSQLFIGNRKAVFTANGTFSVPSYVSTIWVSGCAGGGGGGSGAGNSSGQSTLVGGGGGGGGGAGQNVIKYPISVTGGHSLSVSIGAAGAAGTNGTTNAGSSGTAGGNTVLTDSTSSTTLLTLTGGDGGGAGAVPSANTVGGGGAGGAPGSGYPYGSGGTDGNYPGNGGPGASSPFGGGGGGARGSIGGAISGFDASGYGSGGGGGGDGYGSSSAVNGGAGGNGAPGFLVIEW